MSTTGTTMIVATLTFGVRVNPDRCNATKRDGARLQVCDLAHGHDGQHMMYGLGDGEVACWDKETW